MNIFRRSWFLMILFVSAATTKSFASGDKSFLKSGLPGQYKSDPKARLFLITVIDSDDSIIGERCETDLEEMTASFEDLCLMLDLATVYPKVIQGDEYSKAAVNEAINGWLKSMAPNRDDIVVFYFSGHGFRFPNDASPYPRMWLKTSSDQNVETTNLRMEEDIYYQIVKMGAGVNIILSDCCNSVPGANTSFAVKMTKNKHHAPKPEEMEGDMKDFNNLFLPDKPLSIIATAADSTELAGGTADDGGFFTHFFLEALDKSVFEDELDASWAAILNFAKEEARKKALAGVCPANKHNGNGRCVQTAKFKIKQ